MSWSEVWILPIKILLDASAMQEMLIGEIYQDLEIITAIDSFSANRSSKNTLTWHIFSESDKIIL